nr:LysR family transcriptional regulator [Nocardiopsis salina]
MRGIEIRELECFLLVAEELHFGRVAMRLGLSVERARELVERLEHRIGTPLLDTSGERLRLSPFGEEFLASLRPAYGALVSVLEDARDRASSGRRLVRLGFPGPMRDPVARAVKVFEERSPEARVEVVENPLDDPFGPLRDGRVDAAVVLLPVRERDLASRRGSRSRPITRWPRASRSGWRTWRGCRSYRCVAHPTTGCGCTRPQSPRWARRSSSTTAWTAWTTGCGRSR